MTCMFCGRQATIQHADSLYCERCWQKLKHVLEDEVDYTRNIIPGTWCDDITFCQEQCDLLSCPRNQKNIWDKTVPHSFSVEIPDDCPKKWRPVKWE